MTAEDIKRYAEEVYGAKPERLWRRYPRYFVLRRRDSGKWFSVIMKVPRRRLGLEGRGETYVGAAKCGPLMKEYFLSKPGFIPAYHMNKSSWVSFLPREGAREDIKSLLDLSYDLCGPGKGRKGPG